MYFPSRRRACNDTLFEDGREKIRRVRLAVNYPRGTEETKSARAYLLSDDITRLYVDITVNPRYFSRNIVISFIFNKSGGFLFYRKR